MRSRVPSKRNRFSVMHDCTGVHFIESFPHPARFQESPDSCSNKVAVLLAAWRCLIHHDCIPP